jgi:nucleotide-binding universal stress UspA family protein
MTGQIIVGYNATSASREALNWAAAEAAARSCEMRVISCYELAASDPFGWAMLAPIEALLDGAAQMANEAVQIVLSAHPDLKVSADVAGGPASRALVDAAMPGDLMVIGSSEHHGAAALLSSTPRSVVRHSACPVVVVRGGVSRGRPDRVVVGVDGSAASAAAIAWAAAEADLHRVPLEVVHAWWYPYVVSGRSFARDAMRVDAQLVLDDAVRTAREQCLSTVTGTLQEGDPATGLLEGVRDGDLLVLAPSGHGAIARSLLGSTVNSVLDRVFVPVAVVPGAPQTPEAAAVGDQRS